MNCALTLIALTFLSSFSFGQVSVGMSVVLKADEIELSFIDRQTVVIRPDKMGEVKQLLVSELKQVIKIDIDQDRGNRLPYLNVDFFLKAQNAKRELLVGFPILPEHCLHGHEGWVKLTDKLKEIADSDEK